MSGVEWVRRVSGDDAPAPSHRPGGRLQDEVVVATGGAQGTGRAVVQVALREGATVAELDVDAAAGRLLVEHSSGADLVFHEVTDASVVRTALAHIATAVGRVGVLVNNAGRNAYGDAVSMTGREWDDVYALDLNAAWLCTKHALPYMANRGAAAVVKVASVHAQMTAEGMFPYRAAKAGLLGLTRSLALDLGPRGIRVNSVSPGYTRTRLVQESLASLENAEAQHTIEGTHALRRMGEATEVAEVICFLGSRAASFVTGADWVVDGGLSARFA